MCHVRYRRRPYDHVVASMFDTIAEMLRGSAPDDLAHALGTDRTQTRRAMEIGLPALITGLRDKTLEPGGAQNLASMLGEPSATVPGDLDAYLAAGDPSQGAAMLDVAFGDRGEPALASLSSASGLSTRLLAQVMSVLAPLATGTVAATADRTPDGLRSYLASAVEDLEDKGFGRVVDLVSPAGLTASVAPVVDVVPESGDAPADTGPVDLGEDQDLSSVDGAIELDGLTDLDDDAPDFVATGSGANVVEGAFPEIEDIVPAHNSGIEIGDSTEALDLRETMPSFDSEVANVAPAGVVIAAPDAEATIALADAPAITPPDQELELEGQGLSSMGWLWWIIGAVLGILLLLFALTRCGGSDDPDAEGVNATETVEAVTPTPDPLVAQRQASVDAILVNYPGVRAEVVGDVAILTGTVATDVQAAELDAAVRAVTGVNFQVTVTDVADAVTPGYTLNDLIDVQAELSTLRALLDQAGLRDALSGNAEFTLFAPTNTAFAAISDELAAAEGDQDALRAILFYHLLQTPQDAAAITASASLPTMLEGQSIEVNADGGRVVLNGRAQVLLPDAAANNGIMHIIDTVLLPQTAQSMPEDIGAALSLAPITFSSGGSELTDAGRVELDKVAAFLQANPGSIEIAGHTDSDGAAELNQTISQQRANAVKTYLESQGVPAESMTAVGFGEDQPIVANDSPENKAKNRRIEFRPL